MQNVPLRFVTAPVAEDKPVLRNLKRMAADERILAIDPKEELRVDIPEAVIADWILCFCTVRGKVVKSVPQPSGRSRDYPVCNARVHVCEVDRLPEIIWTLPDHILDRLRAELVNPITWPAALTSGPPEKPGYITTSVCK